MQEERFRDGGNQLWARGTYYASSQKGYNSGVLDARLIQRAG